MSLKAGGVKVLVIGRRALNLCKIEAGQDKLRGLNGEVFGNFKIERRNIFSMLEV